MTNPTRPYNRTEINLLFVKIKTQLHQKAKIIGGGEIAQFIDCYTGKTLHGGDQYDYEHIRSSESIFMMYRAKLTNLEIAEVVNCPENVSVTLRTINQSKGKIKMEDWMAKANNISRYNIDVSLTKNSLSNSDKAILKKVEEIESR